MMGYLYFLIVCGMIWFAAVIGSVALFCWTAARDDDGTYGVDADPTDGRGSDVFGGRR